MELTLTQALYLNQNPKTLTLNPNTYYMYPMINP